MRTPDGAGDTGWWMVADGFEVDLSALRGASEGVNDVLGDLAEKNAGDLAPSSAAFGHEGLASTRSTVDDAQADAELRGDIDRFLARTAEHA